MKIHYEVVYKKVNLDTRKQLVDMWVNSKALSKQEAERRVEEVVVVAKENSAIIGACSVYTSIFKPKNKLYYFFRQFMSKPVYREVDEFSFLTRETLKNFECSPKPFGIIIEVQNKRITDRILTRVAGWHLFGYNDKGQRIAYYNFDDSLM